MAIPSDSIDKKLTVEEQAEAQWNRRVKLSELPLKQVAKMRKTMMSHISAREEAKTR